MATAREFVDAALAEVGYTESPPGSNRTKFAPEAGHANGQPWCATGVVAIARRVGLKLPSESAYTPTMAAGFQRVNRWHTGTPELGDIGFIDFPGDSKRRIQHVVIVTGVRSDGAVMTVEFNTSSGSQGSQDNGGGVYRRVRARSLFVGFGRPAFTNQEDDLTPEDRRMLAEVHQRSEWILGAAERSDKDHRDNTGNLSQRLDSIEERIKNLELSGGSVDVNALAKAVADELHRRTES